MQSSCNVIKNIQVIPQGDKEIVTKANNYNLAANRRLDNKIEINTDTENNNDVEKQNFEMLSRSIISNAQIYSDELIAKAYEMAMNVEKEAYNKGYKSGSELGFKEAYEKAIPNAKTEADKIIRQANNILFNSKIEYESYVDEKKDEIIKLSMSMAETILKKELSTAEGLNEVILEALSKSRNAEVYIIKTNSTYTEELKSKVNYWKENFGLRGEIFIVADESVGAFNAVIEKNNGKIIIGLDTGMDAIKQALLD